jgi:hypothetical protein
MRRAAKVDKNQSEVVAELRQRGYHVTHLHQLGQGVPDLLVASYCLRYDAVVLLLVELKTEDGDLTPAEENWHEEFVNHFPSGPHRQEELPLIVARSAQEIAEWFWQRSA